MNENKPMTAEDSIDKSFKESFLHPETILAKMNSMYPIGMRCIFNSMEYYKDSHTAPLLSEIERLKKEVEELKIESVYKKDYDKMAKDLEDLRRKHEVCKAFH